MYETDVSQFLFQSYFCYLLNDLILVEDVHSVQLYQQ